MIENKMLDRKLAAITKKKEENLIKISGLVEKVKKMRVEYYEAESEVNMASEVETRDDSPGENSENIESIDEDEVRKGECPGKALVPVGDQPRSNEDVDDVEVAELKKEEKMLLQKIKESTKNLDDHKKLLETMEMQNGQEVVGDHG